MGSSARIVIARVTGSTRVFTVRTSPSKLRPSKATLRALIESPDSSTPRNDSGTVKSSRTVDKSSSVVITVPGVTRVPGLTWRKPICPAKGARTRLCSKRARAASRRASSAFMVASSCCTWDSDTVFEASSSLARRNWARLSITVASASARTARSSALSSSTRTSPACTVCPSRKRMAVMTLAMREVISTASRARVVPSASTSSTSSRARASTMTTATGGRSSTAARSGASSC